MSSPFSFCNACYSTSIAWCSNPHFIAGLSHNTMYRVRVENHFGQVYTQNITTDTDGNFTLDITLFPSEFFNPYSGMFVLSVETLGGAESDVIYGYQAYPCIIFDVYKETQTN